MKRLIVAAALLLAGPAMAVEDDSVPPYVQSDANAGTTPIPGDQVFKALHGQEGIARIVDGLVDRVTADPRTQDIFRNANFTRLRRLLKEDICYISGGPCHYTGMDMLKAHRHMGLQAHDFNALVEDLEDAMTKEGVPWRMQAKLLAKLAPMKTPVVDGSQN